MEPEYHRQTVKRQHLKSRPHIPSGYTIPNALEAGVFEPLGPKKIYQTKLYFRHTINDALNDL